MNIERQKYDYTDRQKERVANILKRNKNCHIQKEKRVNSFWWFTLNDKQSLPHICLQIQIKIQIQYDHLGTNIIGASRYSGKMQIPNPNAASPLRDEVNSCKKRKLTPRLLRLR